MRYLTFQTNIETAPAAHLELKSLGLPESKTPLLSEVLCRVIAEQTGDLTQRVYIEFAAPARHM